MAGLRKTLDRPARRLLTAMEAAAYCGAPSIVKWRSSCSVRGVAVYDGRDGTRYDVADLDQWIERMKGSLPSKEDWLARLGNDGDPIEGG
ncbi:MAG: hypothetical protein P0Y66_22455 [Candidatus Kaistia colombiensis]|nr:MAG: hypothetical protein P0Y66_22455 [Kaistia sp.]